MTDKSYEGYLMEQAHGMNTPNFTQGDIECLKLVFNLSPT